MVLNCLEPFKYEANQQALSRESLHIFCRPYIYKYNEGKHRDLLDTQSAQKPKREVQGNQVGLLRLGGAASRCSSESFAETSSETY